MQTDGSISSVVQGVSGQEPRERLPGQCTLQENMSSDPVLGLVPRPSTEYINTLFSDTDVWNFTDFDNKSDGIFTVATRDGGIRMFDVTGTEHVITIDSGTASYLTDNKVRVVNLEDAVYVVNPAITVEKLPDLTAFYTSGALVHTLGGQYGRTYQLDFTWYSSTNVKTTASCKVVTPDGSGSNHILSISTVEIIADFVGQGTDSNSTTSNNFVNTAALTAVFDWFRKDDVLFFKPKVGADVAQFTVTSTDGDAGTNLKVTNSKVKEVADLPQYAPHGYHVKIEGSEASEDDWYVRFECEPDSTGAYPALGAGFGTPGVWIECAASGIDYKLDPATMPHVLEKTGPYAYTFKRGSWKHREVGDDTTNPFPSFVGHTLEDVNTFQGRLVLVSDVNCIMSRTDKPTDFFNQSATALADSDPIDMSSKLGKYRLYSITPHNRDLVVSSEKAQFIVFGRAALTPLNASLVLTTEFEVDLRARPVSAGKNVVFAYKFGSFVGCQEFYTEGNADANNSRPITQHVPKYIPGRAYQLAASTNFSKLCVLTDDTFSMWMYEFIWVDDRKAQTSWSKWTFSQAIKRVFFDDNRMYVIVFDGSNYILQYMNLDIVSDIGVPYRVCLDSKSTFTAVSTTLTIPYNVSSVNDLVVVQGQGCPYPGMLVGVQSLVDDVVTLDTDMRGGSVIVGQKYLRRWQPTMPMVKDEAASKIDVGTLIVSSFSLAFKDTGHFVAVATDKYGYRNELVYEARTVGDPDNLLDVAVVDSGVQEIPFKKNADRAILEIQSNSHLPVQIIELGWIGQWFKRGKRIVTGG